MKSHEASLAYKTESRRTAVESKRCQCRCKFLQFFPHGFYDPKYIAWERDYKLKAHLEWKQTLNQAAYLALLKERNFSEIAARCMRVESRTNLLFSFEKMAIRDAVKTRAGAELFALGLYDLLHGKGSIASRFYRWTETVSVLPRKQTRVLTWPVITAFGFIAQPHQHIFLKPNTTKKAAAEYGFAFDYNSQPNWKTYETFLEFAGVLRRDLKDLRPRDFIDLQSFIWVLGSSEYAG
jgi:hypothetical protein